MIRKTVKHILIIISILAALASMVSHWHPFHVGEVWDQGAATVNFRIGSMDWFYEANRNRYRGGIVPQTHTGASLPGVAGYYITSDGRTSVYAAGVAVMWCRQSTGYRRYRIAVNFFKLAFFAALYPVISLSIRKTRRFVRRRRGCCLECGYALKGNVSGVCPECGVAIAS